jgi:hypothetical protein
VGDLEVLVGECFIKKFYLRPFFLNYEISSLEIQSYWTIIIYPVTPKNYVIPLQFQDPKVRLKLMVMYSVRTAACYGMSPQDITICNCDLEGIMVIDFDVRLLNY